MRGGLGFGGGWKSGQCDGRCQEYVSACVLAHINSAGQSVPIWVNADPNKVPGVGFGLAYQSGKDTNMQEGVFMGNILSMNPPQAYFAKSNGFKGNIPGRLGASGSNPYKPWDGYRVDNDTFYSGVAAALCYQRQAPDGIHWDYTDCGRRDVPRGPITRGWANVVTTYVNGNYSGAVSQNYAARTVAFSHLDRPEDPGRLGHPYPQRVRLLQQRQRVQRRPDQRSRHSRPSHGLRRQHPAPGDHEERR